MKAVLVYPSIQQLTQWKRKTYVIERKSVNFINFQGCFCHQAKMRVIRLEGKMNAELQLPNETFIDEVFLNLDLKEVDQTFLISETTPIRIIKHCSYCMAHTVSLILNSLIHWLIRINGIERFEMLKDVNLHRQCYNQRKQSKRGSNRSTNSALSSGTWFFSMESSDWLWIIVPTSANHISGMQPAIPSLEEKTECTRLHCLIILRFQFKLRSTKNWL